MRLAIEIALLALMLVVILYCRRLDRHLRVLRSGRETMLKAAGDLGVAVGAARSVLGELRAGAVASRVAESRGHDRPSSLPDTADAAMPNEILALTDRLPPQPHLRRRSGG